MTIESLEGVLREHAFLQGLPEEHARTLVGCAANAVFPEGQVLAREGTPADTMFLLRKGHIALEIHTRGGGLRIETVHEGDVLGVSCFLEPFVWRFDARAVSPVRAITLDASCLRRKLSEDHEFGYQLLSRLIVRQQARLQAARLQLLDVYGAIRGMKDVDRF